MQILRNFRMNGLLIPAGLYVSIIVLLMGMILEFKV